jgi:lactoylglutathione lyase
MRTLHLGLRVAGRERSLAFYEAVGYEVVGSVPATALGHLTMLKLPEDEFVTIELVSDPPDGRRVVGSTLSHFVIKVESLCATMEALRSKGVDVDGPEPVDQPSGPQTAWITDPDGNRIELVQWPPGHPDGMTATDWPE